MDKKESVVEDFRMTFLRFLTFIFYSGVLLASPTVKKLGEVPIKSDLQIVSADVIKKLPTKDWVTIEKELSSPNSKLVSKSKSFSIESMEECASCGDLARYKMNLLRNGKKAPLAKEALSWAVVTPDERYILHEPLTLIDTRDWKSTNLVKIIGVEGYFKVLKYSPSQRRLLVASFGCVMDCPAELKSTLWEIILNDSN